MTAPDPDTLRLLSPEEEAIVDAWMAEHPEYVEHVLRRVRAVQHEGPDQ